MSGQPDQSGSTGEDSADPSRPATGDGQDAARSPRPASAGSLPARLRGVYAERVGEAEQALLQSWAAFTVTFGAVRGITHWLRRRSGSGGSGGIVIAGKHLHHYNLGILLLASVGGVAVHGQEHRRRHPFTALSYGSGTALIVDELALLLDLSDVYWSRQGRTSVDTAVGVIGVGGLVLAAVPFWQGAAHEVARTRPQAPSRRTR